MEELEKQEGTVRKQRERFAAEMFTGEERVGCLSGNPVALRAARLQPCWLSPSFLSLPRGVKSWL